MFTKTEEHFWDKQVIEELNQSIEDFDVQIIVQLENFPCQKSQSRKLKH